MLHIGPHKLTNNVFLAPMAGITDAPFRELCAREGAAFAASEMISSDAMLFATNKTRHRIKRVDNGLPHAVQIAGSEPEAMADVAELNVRFGAEVIDINMGCPAKKVCNKAAGSALLEHPELVRDIIKSVVARVDVPVTLKIRTGASPEQRNGVAIARLAEQEGIACLAVHGRTRADRFKGRADGVMIGRAAQGNPWLFKSITEQLGGRTIPLPPTTEQIYETLTTHLNGLYELYGEYTGVRVARKHIAWYCKGIRNATEFRVRAYAKETSVEQLAIIEEFFTCPDSFAAAA